MSDKMQFPRTLHLLSSDEVRGRISAVYYGDIDFMNQFEVTPLTQPSFDLISHIKRQQEWSFKTFGPPGQGQRPEGVIDHLKKEIDELKGDPTNKKEWIDVIILGIDGLLKSGYSPEEITRELDAKQSRNEARQWPDWRTAPKDRAIEHVRTEIQDGKCVKCGIPREQGHLSNCEFY